MKDMPRRRFPIPFPKRGRPSEEENLWIRCPSCHEHLYQKECDDNLRVCPKCRYHFRLSLEERVAMLLDADSFDEHDRGLRGTDPLKFRSEGQVYAERLVEHERKAGTPEALVYGTAAIEDEQVVVAISNFAFQGGSMGVAVGEKVARAADLAVARRLPLLTVTASGGARQHEGVFALMQMAKTTAALARLGRVGMPYLSLLTDPTVGGVPASYAMLGDVVFAEPGAFIGFAGPRVIEQAIGQKLPPGTATAESMLAHGMLDLVVPRAELRSTIGRLLRLLTAPSYRSRADALPEPRAAVAAVAGTEGRDLGRI